jgi:hypothetical protein
MLSLSVLRQQTVQVHRIVACFENRLAQLAFSFLHLSPHRLLPRQYNIGNVERDPYDRQGRPEERSDRAAGFAVSRFSLFEQLNFEPSYERRRDRRMIASSSYER